MDGGNEAGVPVAHGEPRMRLHDTALMLPELAAIKGMNAKKDYIEAPEDNGEFIGMLRLCLDPLLAYNISMKR